METFLIKKEEPSKSRRKFINSNGRPRLWSEDDRFSPIPTNYRFSGEKSNRGMESFSFLFQCVLNVLKMFSIFLSLESEIKIIEHNCPYHRNYSDPENNMQWTPEIPFENVICFFCKKK